MTKNAAAEGKLGQLHAKVADVLLSTLSAYDKAQELTQQRLGAAVDDPDMEIQTVVEPSGALLGAAIKFLKDNEITCQIEENAGLSSLEKRLAAKAASRANVVALRDVAVGE